MKNIIIDTDIGDDIDDALALALAVGLDQVNLRAVVTVFAEVQTRARIASKLLAAADRNDIPVAAGLADPLKHRPAPNRWIDWQSRGLDLESVGAIAAMPGPEFIAQSLGSSEGLTTLVGIGPLTNIATVLTAHPSVTERIDEIVIMGGWFSGPHPEWNMSLDPDAAQIVFDAGIPMRVIPIDVTRECLMSEAQLHDVSTGKRPALQYLWNLIEGWGERTGEKYPVLHDPLAIGCIAVPEIYSFQRCRVDVDLEPGRNYGATRAIPDDMSHIQVCDAVDYDAFAEFFGAHLIGTSSIMRT